MYTLTKVKNGTAVDHIQFQNPMTIKDMGQEPFKVPDEKFSIWTKNGSFPTEKRKPVDIHWLLRQGDGDSIKISLYENTDLWTTSVPAGNGMTGVTVGALWQCVLFILIHI